MFDNRQGDLYIFSTLDGGEIVVKNGEPVLNQGLETAVYISLEGSKSDWFANEFLQGSQKLISSFAKYRESVTLTTGVINTSIELIKQDLQWLINDKIANAINVNMNIIGNNRVEIKISIRNGREEIKLSPYQLNWNAQQDYPVNARI